MPNTALTNHLEPQNKNDFEALGLLGEHGLSPLLLFDRDFLERKSNIDALRFPDLLHN